MDMKKEMLEIVLKEVVEKSLFDYLKENNDLPTLYKMINTLNGIDSQQIAYSLRTENIYKANKYGKYATLVGQKFYIERYDGRNVVVVYEMAVEI